MFENLVKPLKLTTTDNDFRQPFDPTNSAMFKRYESGYALFFVIDIPNILTELTKNEKGSVTGIQYRSLYADLISSYIRTLEREFKRLDGLENISSEGIEYSGLNEVTVNAINAVQEQHNGVISLTYTETYGEVLTKVNELYLKGIDDPIIGHRKHYNGLIDDKILAPSFKNEVFSFLYLVTDNTGLQLERAYYIFNAQPITSHVGDLYNITRGEYENKELTLEFRCNILSNKSVFKQARTILGAITGYQYVESLDKFIQVTKPAFEQDSTVYEYQALINSDKRIGTLNYSGKDINKISALNKVFDTDYEDVKNVSEVETSLNTTAKTNYAELNDGDHSTLNTSSRKYAIDRPLAKINDIIYIKSKATLANMYGNRVNPTTTTFKGNTSPVCIIKAVLDKSTAQIWANENKNGVVYGKGAKLYAYCIAIAGTTYYVKADSFYILDGSIWRDPITGLEIDIDTKDPKINKPLYKVGDKVTLRSGEAIPVYQTFTSSTILMCTTATYSSQVFVISEVASESSAKEIMNTYNTNYPYAHPNFHPYKLKLDESYTDYFGCVNEEDLKLVSNTSSSEPSDPNADKEKEDEEHKALITKLAWECIRGDWGNGETRKQKLTKAGYNYTEVQTEVNRLLNEHYGGNYPV